MLQVFFVYTTIIGMTNTKRPRGAPKKDNPASEQVLIRSTPDEKSAWRKAATAKGLSLSTWLKDLANEAALVNEEGDGSRRDS